MNPRGAAVVMMEHDRGTGVRQVDHRRAREREGMLMMVAVVSSRPRREVVLLVVVRHRHCSRVHGTWCHSCRRRRAWRLLLLRRIEEGLLGRVLILDRRIVVLVMILRERMELLLLLQMQMMRMRRHEGR